MWQHHLSSFHWIVGTLCSVHYLVSFLVFQPSWRGRESWLLYSQCLSGVLWLLVITVMWMDCVISWSYSHTFCTHLLHTMVKAGKLTYSGSVVVDFLCIVAPIVGVCNYSMFCCTLLYVHSSIAIILMGNWELVALLNLSSWCLVMVERLFIAVPWGCMRGLWLWYFLIILTYFFFLVSSKTVSAFKCFNFLCCLPYLYPTWVGQCTSKLENRPVMHWRIFSFGLINALNLAHCIYRGAIGYNCF